MAQEQVDLETTGLLFAEEPGENEEDDAISEEEAGSAVLHSTDWTTETLLSQMAKENIDVAPTFQRRDVWSVEHKSKFIESLILGIPVPQLVLAEQAERGRYLVLDGKQRLLTLQQFFGKGKGRKNAFPLKRLPILRNLEGVTHETLSESANLRSYLTALENATIRTVVIKRWPSENYIHTVFVRLNSNSVMLSPQELRQALIPGPFTEFLDKAASEITALQDLLGTSEPDFRMRDVELLLRHLAFKNAPGMYRGNLKEFLDKYCKDVTNAWPNIRRQVADDVAHYEVALRLGQEIFQGNLGRKWLGNRFESRLNRAVLDVQTHYFSNPDIGGAASERPDKVFEAFGELCKESAFKEAVEQTTKSLTAMNSRFTLWAHALSRVLQFSIDPPGFGS